MPRRGRENKQEAHWLRSKNFASQRAKQTNSNRNRNLYLQDTKTHSHTHTRTDTDTGIHTDTVVESQTQSLASERPKRTELWSIMENEVEEAEEEKTRRVEEQWKCGGSNDRPIVG